MRVPAVLVTLLALALPAAAQEKIEIKSNVKKGLKFTKEQTFEGEGDCKLGGGEGGISLTFKVKLNGETKQVEEINEAKSGMPVESRRQYPKRSSDVDMAMFGKQEDLAHPLEGAEITFRKRSFWGNLLRKRIIDWLKTPCVKVATLGGHQYQLWVFKTRVFQLKMVADETQGDLFGGVGFKRNFIEWADVVERGTTDAVDSLALAGRRRDHRPFHRNAVVGLPPHVMNLGNGQILNKSLQSRAFADLQHVIHDLVQSSRGRYHFFQFSGVCAVCHHRVSKL